MTIKIPFELSLSKAFQDNETLKYVSIKNYSIIILEN